MTGDSALRGRLEMTLTKNKTLFIIFGCVMPFRIDLSFRDPEILRKTLFQMFDCEKVPRDQSLIYKNSLFIT